MFGIAHGTSASDSPDSANAFDPVRGRDTRLSDSEIRAALNATGISTELGFTKQEFVLEEVECCRGYVRADYIVMSDGALSIIEIKSDRDTLRRFEDQVRIYSQVADRVILIVGWSLAAHALRAAPPWWQVVLAERDRTGDVRFVPLRDGATNPGIAASALAAMLPVEELRRLARRTRQSANRLRARELQNLVVADVSCDDLRIAVSEWLVRLSQKRTRIPS